MPFHQPRPRLIHVRKTIAFTGAAGLGEVGTVTVFTVTGVVLLEGRAAICSESLEQALATATIAFGTANSATAFMGTTTATALLAGEIWDDTTPTTAEFEDVSTGAYVVDSNIVVTVGSQNVTNGTIVFDVWYRQVSTGSSIVAA